MRLKHLPTGITVTAADTRSQYRNRLLRVFYLERGLLPDGSAVSVADLDRMLQEGEEEPLF